MLESKRSLPMGLKFLPNNKISPGAGILAWSLLLLPQVSFAQRESKAQKELNTQALRRVLITLARWDLAVASERGKLPEDWALLRKKLLPNEQKGFDAAFAPLGSGKADTATANEFYQKIFKRFDVYSAPAQTPDTKLGLETYRDHCATCHGVKADGKSELAQAKLFQKTRPPADFTDPAFLRRSDPFRIYNVLLQGIPDTAKVSYATRLTDHQMWSLAFVLQGVGSMGSLAGFETCRSSDKKDATLTQVAKGMSLKQLATSSDTILVAKQSGSAAATQLAAARCFAPFDSTTPR